MNIESLEKLGFKTITDRNHMYSSIPITALYKGSIEVWRGTDFMVRLCAGHTDFALENIRTIDQLKTLYELIEGKPLEEAA